MQDWKVNVRITVFRCTEMSWCSCWWTLDLFEQSLVRLTVVILIGQSVKCTYIDQNTQHSTIKFHELDIFAEIWKIWSILGRFVYEKQKIRMWIVLNVIQSYSVAFSVACWRIEGRIFLLIGLIWKLDVKSNLGSFEKPSLNRATSGKLGEGDMLWWGYCNEGKGCTVIELKAESIMKQFSISWFHLAMANREKSGHSTGERGVFGGRFWGVQRSRGNVVRLGSWS